MILSNHSENNDENKEHNQPQINSLSNQRREKFSNQGNLCLAKMSAKSSYNRLTEGRVILKFSLSILCRQRNGS